MAMSEACSNVGADASVTTRFSVSSHGQFNSPPLASDRRRRTVAAISKAGARNLSVPHDGMNVANEEKSAGHAHRQVHSAADRDQIAVEIAAVAPDEGGPSGLAARCACDDADHRPDRQTQVAELQHAVDDRTQARDGPLDHFGYDAEARFDQGIAVIVQINVEDLDRQHVAGFGALDGDRSRRWIGPGKAVATVGGGGFDVLRAAEPAAARIQRVDDDLRRRRDRQPRLQAGVDDVDDLVGLQAIWLRWQEAPPKKSGYAINRGLHPRR